MLLTRCKLIKYKLTMESYKSYVTCQCIFFQLIIGSVLILLETLFFSMNETNFQTQGTIVSENKAVILASMLPTYMNFIDAMTNSTISDLNQVYEQTQTIYSPSFANFETFCLNSTKANCPVYGYDSTHLSSYITDPIYENKTWDYNFLYVSDETGSSLTMSDSQTAISQQFWNQIYLVVPVYLNMFRTYNNHSKYISYLQSLSIIKYDTNNNLFLQWSYPNDNNHKINSTKFYYDQATSLNLTIKRPSLYHNITSGLYYVFYKMDSTMLAMIEQKYDVLFRGYQNFNVSYQNNWYIISETDEQKTGYPNSALPSKELLYPVETGYYAGGENLICEFDHKTDCLMYTTRLIRLSDAIKYYYMVSLYLSGNELDTTGQEFLRLSRFVCYFSFLIVIISLGMLNIHIFRKVYYQLFSQQNHFTYLISTYTEDMMKEIKESDRNEIDKDLCIFRENSEIKTFIDLFFEFFKKNKEFNQLNLEKEFDQNSRDVIKDKIFIRKFNENILGFIKERFNFLLAKPSLRSQRNTMRTRTRIDIRPSRESIVTKEAKFSLRAQTITEDEPSNRENMYDQPNIDIQQSDQIKNQVFKQPSDRSVITESSNEDEFCSPPKIRKSPYAESKSGNDLDTPDKKSNLSQGKEIEKLRDVNSLKSESSESDKEATAKYGDDEPIYESKGAGQGDKSSLDSLSDAEINEIKMSGERSD